MKKRYIIHRIILSLVLMAGFIGWLAYQDETANPQEAQAVSGSAPAAIGGDFTLINQYGETVTDGQLRGKYLLVYFGFTFCPDICPTTLLAITNVMHSLGDQSAHVVPVFISVDPERDTVALLAAYAKNFHPALVALTGTREQVNRAIKAYRVYGTAEQAEKPGSNYMVQHSGFVYLMGKDGTYIRHFASGASEAEMLAAIRKELEKE